RSFFLFAFFIAQQAMAQQPPPKLEPIPDPPPPATALDDEALNDRGVKIAPGERAEEFMTDGKRVIRVTKPNGAVYYLIEDIAGYVGPAGTDSSDSRIRAPQWLIYQW